MHLNDHDNAPRHILREIGEGYSVYDYPKREACEVAERAAAAFARHFAHVSGAVGLAGQNVPPRYLEVRGSPFVNFRLDDGNGSFGVVAETEARELPLEFLVHRGSVKTGGGEFQRWEKLGKPIHFNKAQLSQVLMSKKHGGCVRMP